MRKKIISAPTPFYPSLNGKPMAETHWHCKLLMELLKTTKLLTLIILTRMYL